MARVHRIGQTKPVHVYRLCTEGTIEERIQRRADSKLYLDQMVNRGSTAQAQALEVRIVFFCVVLVFWLGFVSSARASFPLALLRAFGAPPPFVARGPSTHPQSPFTTKTN
jgi:hypothetical protein